MGSLDTIKHYQFYSVNYYIAKIQVLNDKKYHINVLSSKFTVNNHVFSVDQ